MNYSKTNMMETNGLILTVKKKKNVYNIQISKKLPLLSKENFEEINQIITTINEESLHGSFYFCDGTLTFQMLLNEYLNEKSLKSKLNISIAAFESILKLLEVKFYEK